MALDLKALLTRTIVVIIGAPLILFLAYQGGYWLLAFLLVICTIGLWEYRGLAAAKGYPSPLWVLMGGGWLLLAAMSIDGAYVHRTYVPLAMALALIAAFAHFAVQTDRTRVLENLGITLLGIVYIVGLPGHLLFYADWGPSGGIWVVTVFLMVWGFDIFAYLVGSLCGKHKMFSALSPKKSWEGLAGGILGIAVVLVLVAWWQPSLFALRDYVFVPVLAGLGALFGDLFESMLKRDAQVKDTSNLLPGHGGMLDRFDSLFVVAPTIYWYLYLTAAR
jgi:phosphatidate cytidylyltransferase